MRITASEMLTLRLASVILDKLVVDVLEENPDNIKLAKELINARVTMEAKRWETNQTANLHIAECPYCGDDYDRLACNRTELTDGSFGDVCPNCNNEAQELIKDKDAADAVQAATDFVEDDNQT